MQVEIECPDCKAKQDETIDHFEEAYEEEFECKQCGCEFYAEIEVEAVVNEGKVIAHGSVWEQNRAMEFNAWYEYVASQTGDLFEKQRMEGTSR
jgi:Zn ribbon nucleic-acid-binding protein